MIKREERKTTIRHWQARWVATSKASWTRTLIPDVGRWLGKTVPKVPLSFHMTQALTGHGCFQAYLHRMGRATSPVCLLCGQERDDANHTLFECEFFEGHRDGLRERLGRIPRAADLAELLCGPDFEGLPASHEEMNRILIDNEEDFRQFYRMVESIMKLKELEERARQDAEGRLPR